MGCDICCYLEAEVPDDDYRGTLFLGEVGYYTIGGRNYTLFGLLAGVRGDYGVEPVVEPRGFPKEASTELLNRFYLTIVDKDKPHTYWREVREGDPVLGKGKRVSVEHPPKSPPYLIHDTDFHTPSYIYLDELREVCRVYKKLSKKDFNEGYPYDKDDVRNTAELRRLSLGVTDAYASLKSIVEFMKTRESYLPHEKVRLVFWFN